MALLPAPAREWTPKCNQRVSCVWPEVGDEDCRRVVVVVVEQTQVSLFKSHGQMKGDRLVADWTSPHQMVEA